jgi:hypothetical protein
VQNFELLNPSRTLFRKYTDLYRDIDKGDERFLEFETLVGRLLPAERAGDPLDRRAALRRQPPGQERGAARARPPGRPQGDPLADHRLRQPRRQHHAAAAGAELDRRDLCRRAEIRIRGQRIIYMVHDEVGHLGIFVSGPSPRRSTAEVASTLKTIEALAPGLYEMRDRGCHEKKGQPSSFTVSFAERTFDDIRALDDGLATSAPSPPSRAHPRCRRRSTTRWCALRSAMVTARPPR